MKLLNRFLILSLSLLAVSCTSGSGGDDYTVTSPTIELSINSKGEVQQMAFVRSGIVRTVEGATHLKDCEVISVKSSEDKSGSVTFIKEVKHNGSSEICTVTEVFTPTENSIRWDVTIQGGGENWTTPIESQLKYVAEDSVSHWLPWADPRGDISKGGTDNALIANAIINSGDLSAFNSWEDPLTTRPLQDALWHFGAPRYEYENPGILYCPFQGDVVTIPMITFMEPSRDLAVSFVASLEDLILDLNVETTADGGVKFSRFNHRIGSENSIHFAMDIVTHKADWRDAMSWTTERYKEYFMPVNPLSQKIAGTGAYSNSDKPFDVEKMKKMAFGINWRASFDFPYMGMFIPPVKDKNESWFSFVREREQSTINRKVTSIASMQNYCKKMDDNDFHVLNYFNVTEFGTLIEFPRPASKLKEGEPLWKSANDYLYTKLSDAMLFVPDKQVAVTDKGIYSAYPGKPFWTWEKAVAMDPGVKCYSDFLVEQAHRSVDNLPNSYGICIDRMDWTRFYNHKTDDKVSWMGDQEVGSQHVSWQNIISKLHPIFHDNNKVIFVNNHVKRIDQLRYVDGIFDEFTYAGSPTNTIGLMCMKKPALGWMSNDSQLQPDPDKVMQKYLYMGIFPMCPFPGNDHSMRPSELADRVYLDYGPLIKLLKGKEWVLKPHVVSVANNTAKVNMFKIFDGYSVPVVYSSSDKVDVVIRDNDLTRGDLEILAYYPGESKGTVVEYKQIDNVLRVYADTKRGCAMLHIKKIEK